MGNQAGWEPGVPGAHQGCMVRRSRDCVGECDCRRARLRGHRMGNQAGCEPVVCRPWSCGTPLTAGRECLAAPTAGQQSPRLGSKCSQACSGRATVIFSSKLQYCTLHSPQNSPVSSVLFSHFSALCYDKSEGDRGGGGVTRSMVVTGPHQLQCEPEPWL